MSHVLIPRAARTLTMTALRRQGPAAAATSATTTTTFLRFYKGQAGEHPAKVSDKEEALARVAQPKSDEIRARHLRLPDLNEIPPASLDPTKTQDNLDIRRKRLVYRSKQRGWLEVDLLLGTWAHENVHTLNEEELDQYEAFVNLETIDIYNCITLRLDVPEDMKTPDGNGVVERIQAWARSSPLGQADPEKYKEVKTASKLI
eukprot:scaffold4976_cov161-Amphora_coffeaeformis.AAC.15